MVFASITNADAFKSHIGLKQLMKIITHREITYSIWGLETDRLGGLTLILVACCEKN